MNNISMENSNHFQFSNWKCYGHIKKKAIEQEFSWSGLLISCSVAFFVVIISAVFLNFVHDEVIKKGTIGIEEPSMHEIKRV